MAEPKPLASLTSGLLARKGEAQPAMRRPMPGFGRASAPSVQQDDLGWNDMGHDAPDAATQAAPLPPVVAQREQLEARLANAPMPRGAATAAGRKAAFTLRLDAERHLKLRLACAVDGRSAQMIVTQALDMFLNGLPDIDRLAQQLPRKSGGRSTKGG